MVVPRAAPLGELPLRKTVGGQGAKRKGDVEEGGGGGRGGAARRAARGAPFTEGGREPHRILLFYQSGFLWALPRPERPGFPCTGMPRATRGLGGGPAVGK